MMHGVNEVRKQWGRNIRNARGPAGFKTQEDLARAMGVTQGTVARWESGDTVPTDEHKAALASVLHQEVRQLFPLFATPPKVTA